MGGEGARVKKRGMEEGVVWPDVYEIVFLGLYLLGDWERCVHVREIVYPCSWMAHCTQEK